jgi:hypothetical protein
MKKEDFIPGEWYTSSAFKNTVAFRFLKLSEKGGVEGSEFIKLSDKKHYPYSVIFSFFDFQLKTFKRLSLLEVFMYLPHDHPQKNLVSAAEKEVDSFPLSGCCTNNVQIYNYLINTLKYRPYTKHEDTYNPSKSYIKWFFRADTKIPSILFMNTCSTTVKVHNVESLVNLITKPNNSTNEQKNNITEIHRSTQKINRSNRGRAVTMGCTGQQVATGSRPRGNASRIIKTTSSSVRAEICPQIGQRRNS